MASGGKKAMMMQQQGGVTLEALMDRLNEIDANQSVRAREEAERALRREAPLEERLLRAVDDKISAAMADARATSLGSQQGDGMIPRGGDESVSGVKAKEAAFFYQGKRTYIGLDQLTTASSTFPQKNTNVKPKAGNLVTTSKEEACGGEKKGVIGTVESVPEKVVEAEEDMDSACASSNPHPMKFRGMIGNKVVYALIGTASSNSFIRPAVLKGVECKLVSITPKVFEDIIGEHMVTVTKCQGLNYSIQGYEFKDDFLVMDIYGCDLVLGTDWMTRCGPVAMGGGFVSFKRNGQLVKLGMGEVTGSGKGSEVVAPQVMYIQPVKDEERICQALKRYSNASKLPTMGTDEKWKVEPIAIHKRRVVKRNNKVVPQILVQWSTLPESKATWEDYDDIKEQFPTSTLEDKDDSKRRRNVRYGNSH